MTADHSAQFGDVMALLDGELRGDAADQVRLHLSACVECQRIAADLRGVSGRLQEWSVGDTPKSLQVRPVYRWLHDRTFLAATATVVLVTGATALVLITTPSRRPREVGLSDAKAIAERSLAKAGSAESIDRLSAPQKAIANQAVARGPVIVRTASLSIVVRDYEVGRKELERIARSVDGFMGNLVAANARGAAPSLSATLRVPAARLDEALAALKQLGSVQHERQGSEDVTQQSVDLDARLTNARASEQRLSDILKNRTGRLSDVLAVEREIARVRGEIEQMDAERKTLNSRVTYATVQIEMTTERKAEGIGGPVSVSTRLRNAVVDGYAAAVENAISLTVFLAEILPTVLLGAVVIAPLAWFIRRARQRTARA
jgi:hypothetical protein